MQSKVMTDEGIELTAKRIARMDRPGLIQLLRAMQCQFKIDFSDDYLETLSLERLQHIVLAASLHAQRNSHDGT